MPKEDPNERRGRVSALDIGEVWTGVAISDATRTVARPVEVVASGKLSDSLGTLAREEEVREVVVGVPKTLSGELGFQARRVLDRLDALREEFPELRFVEWDERFTTKMAARDAAEGAIAGAESALPKARARGRAGRNRGRDRGVRREGSGGRVDHLAAARMLQEYLESGGTT